MLLLISRYKNNRYLYQLFHSVTTMGQTMSMRKVYDIIAESTGEDCLPIVRFLNGKKNITEFQIADAVKSEVNQIRSILYRLQTHNLVTYFRKKDREKGWYMSYWTLNPDAATDVETDMRKREVEILKERLEREEKNRDLFYICPNMCARFEFAKAVEIEYRCPECGSILNHQENGRTIERLRDRWKEFEIDA